MSDICKCGHEDKEHIIECWAEGGICDCRGFHDISVERMADVVSAAVRWVNERNGERHPESNCDCTYCTLIRAVDRYVEAGSKHDLETGE